MVDNIKRTAYRFRYVLLVILTICYSIQYLDRVKTNILMPFISKSIGMNTVEIGIGAALMLLFYGPSQMITGWICDKIGSRKVMIFSILSWSVLTYLMGDMHFVGEYYLRMALFGILVGTEFIPSVRLIVRYFPPLQRARAESIVSWAWIITPAWAPILSTYMFKSLNSDWRAVFHVLAFFGIIPLILVLTTVFDRPEKNKFVGKEEAIESYEEEIEQGLIAKADIESGNVDLIENKAKARDIPLSKIIKTPGFIPLTFVYIAAQLAYWGVMTWSAMYLTQVFNFNVMKMGVWASIYFIGGAVGSFGSGWVSDRILNGRRRPMIILCFLLMIPFIIILATLQKGVSPYVLLLTLTGAGIFSNMVWGPAISLPADMFPVEVYGKAMGFVNCFAYMFAAASPYVMGWLIITNPVTKNVNYFWAWIWVAFTAIIGVVAAFKLVDRKNEETLVQKETIA
ncbi:MFS transporter [Desulfotomaculum copahuensis]|uniref:Major facilitator superfamily (MFS) profile domain-containing protein n=1 Tax=Desulfotomaculum copahuensis TaxID=1838280 RepID=A0A1B7LJG1_9FIRM|nr:MFS transporter [Desulfotomaculum copahuensis]OAT86683.1 hypothetical protein A6M21_02345 [Desulfotomaculum copahuensis]